MLVGEIGINHNGSIEKAIGLIYMAKSAGVDVVKFQKRDPNLCVPEDQKGIMKDTPWGRIPYLEYRYYTELSETDYNIIDNYCNSIGIAWTASVWDIPSFNFIHNTYKVPFIKIPSAKITDLDLIKHISKQCTCDIVMSTGMSTEEEIDAAVKILEKNPNRLVIMHCNSSYPAKDNELNLRYISTLRAKYPNHYIGYSGHELGITPSLIAASLGALVIERHITLDRTEWGSDQAASLEYEELYQLSKEFNKILLYLGDGKKQIYESELPSLRKLR